MNILVIDHTKKDMDYLKQIISEAKPEAKVNAVQTFDDALNIADNEVLDLVFIDPDSKDTAQISDFARQLKERNRDIHIIFTSKSKKYMPDAFSVHADAYLIKPVKPEELNSQFEYMLNNYPAPLREIELIARTFGKFNVYYRGKRLTFKRSKSKELLAILIDNRGIGLSTREVCAMLFEGRPYDENTLGYYHVVLTSLNATLAEAGVKNIIRKAVNYISVDPDKIDCDMYRYLRGETEALKDYHGDYMSGYSWSEYSPIPNDSKGEESNAG